MKVSYNSVSGNISFNLLLFSNTNNKLNKVKYKATKLKYFNFFEYKAIENINLIFIQNLFYKKILQK